MQSEIRLALTLNLSPKERISSKGNFAHWTAEPRNWSAGLRPGAFQDSCFTTPCWKPALRFVESGVFLWDLLTTHEPLLVAAFIFKELRVRFMGRKEDGKEGGFPPLANVHRLLTFSALPMAGSLSLGGGEIPC